MVERVEHIIFAFGACAQTTKPLANHPGNIFIAGERVIVGVPAGWAVAGGQLRGDERRERRDSTMGAPILASYRWDITRFGARAGRG
jgi:hypothetical protein